MSAAVGANGLRALFTAVFMVRGLFNSLQFPYAQFARNDLCGDELYDPLWEQFGELRIVD